MIRQGDLVIVDINAVGPSGYYIDFVRCFKCAAKMNQQEIKENMYFAAETFAGHPGLRQTCRPEENVLVSGDGPVVFTLMEHMEEAMR
jgi:Xaa-Pro aminopeptidase